MNSNIASALIIGVVAVAFILYRQLRERPVRENPAKLVVILAAIGAAQTASYLSVHRVVPVGEVVAVVVGFDVAALVATPQARSMRVYRRASDGVMVRSGTPVTAAWWIVAISAHAAIGSLIPLVVDGRAGSPFGGLEQPTLLIYLAVTLGVQGFITAARARRHDRRSPHLVRHL